MKINVLDGGYIALIDMMGSDLRVCEAARVSTGGEASKEEEKDRKLIHYLMKNKHLTPFEKIVFEFHVKAPLFISNQIMRHRVGSFNFASSRYKEFEWECYCPDLWRKQDTKNKQGSLDELDFKDTQELLNRNLFKMYSETEEFYNYAITEGVAREMARIVMPVGQYTEFFWTVNFRSLANFITLRADSHAQKEIQDYANAILKILNSIPEIKWTMEIFSDMLKLERALSKSVNEIGIDQTIKILKKNE